MGRGIVPRRVSRGSVDTVRGIHRTEVFSPCLSLIRIRRSGAAARMSLRSCSRRWPGSHARTTQTEAGLAPGGEEGGGGGVVIGSPDASGGGSPAIVLDGSTTSSGGPCGANGLRCKIAACDAGPKTTVTAKVYDPAGMVPLYNVAVYVPGADVAPIATGATCDNCATPTSGDPIVHALTDATGTFVLQDVPVGTGVPLVMQIGKWRRQITLPEVKPCRARTTLSTIR